VTSAVGEACGFAGKEIQDPARKFRENLRSPGSPSAVSQAHHSGKRYQFGSDREHDMKVYESIYLGSGGGSRAGGMTNAPFYDAFWT
jgi:hypothetical protein